MKRLILTAVLACLVLAHAIAQTASYSLPYDLSAIRSAPPQAPIADPSGKTYSELTGTLAGLQSDLNSQNDALTLYKNLQVKYQNTGYSFANVAFYRNADSLKILKNNYQSAMSLLGANIVTTNKNVAIINADMNRINNVINQRMNNENAQQDFRKWTSFIFAALLAVIIGCFFFVLLRNKSIVTAAALLGENGLQFITLFSIIIAIILFGVLNILEGKELAAIISGIAGFILGKYNPEKVVPVADSGASGEAKH